MEQNEIEYNTEELKYTKESILNSKKYSERKDILSVILKEDEEYTSNDIDDILNKVMKGEINEC